MTCDCEHSGLGQFGRADGPVMIVLLIGIVPLLSRVTTEISNSRKKRKKRPHRKSNRCRSIVNRRHAGGRNRYKDSLVATVSHRQVVGGERPAEFSSFLPPACLRLTVVVLSVLICQASSTRIAEEPVQSSIVPKTKNNIYT